MRKLGLMLVLSALLAQPAAAFEIEDFKSGISKERTKQLLASWNFDQVLDVASDVLIAQDGSDKKTNRQWRFTYCGDRLVALDQALQASLKNFVTASSNYLKSYGQPFKVDTTNHVISNGEKTTLAMFWRVKGDVIGLRYFQYPTGDDLLVTFETPNNCWTAPRP